MLILSIILMGVATTGIGVLPPYATIGVWAPIRLVVLRRLQGFGAGAELAAAMIFVNESTGRKGKGVSGALMNIGSMLGSVLALVFFTVLSSELSSADFKQRGWRIPILFGAVLTVAGLVLRRKVAESPEFEHIAAEQRAGRVERGRANPLAAMAWPFRESPRNFVACFSCPRASTSPASSPRPSGRATSARRSGSPRRRRSSPRC
ncbi:MFS transporter [Amycolatopsis sp. NPDC004368]